MCYAMITSMGDGTLKTKQYNLRMDLGVIDWVNSEAEKDNRTPGIWLSLFLQKHMGKPKKKPTSTSAKVVSQWVAPIGLNIKAWGEFEQHRKDMKKPLTDTARTKAANQICQLTQEEQQETIDRSIQSRWAGLFPEKEKSKSNKSFLEQQSEATREKLFGKRQNVIEGELDDR